MQNGGINMLLEFKTSNFKSFVDDTVFSMTAAPKQKGLDYSLCEEKIKSTKIKGLCSSVIYGPNASGKTNIIGAMDVFRTIVLRGNIRNPEERTSPNPAADSLELIPNIKLDIAKPVEFSVCFTENNFKINYSVKIDIGTFLNKKAQRKITSEILEINNNMVFCRESDLYIGNLKPFQTYVTKSLDIENAMDIAKNSLNPEELFLTNGFKLIFSPSLAQLITNWFSNKFMIIYRANSMQIISKFADPKEKTIYIEKTVADAAKLFGINSNDVGYVVNEDNTKSTLLSIFKSKDKETYNRIPAEAFESCGTIRFINIFPLVIRALKTGATLVIDEFDASIHPIVLVNIVNIFHNNDINIHHAQLIFNTHNPVFLNSNIFRRDEIKFVERDDDNNFSTLYSLADFGTTGSDGVRKNEDYMKNYFISRYGAIRDIDFTPIFEELIHNEGGI